MAKNAAKSEPRLQSASEILSLYVNRPSNTDMATSALRRAMIQVAGERDLGSQETARMLLGKPLYSSTYSFLCVSSYNGDEHEDDNSDDDSEEEPEDWMLLCGLNQRYDDTISRGSRSHENLHFFRQKLPEQCHLIYFVNLPPGSQNEETIL